MDRNDPYAWMYVYLHFSILCMYFRSVLIFCNFLYYSSVGYIVTYIMYDTYIRVVKESTSEELSKLQESNEKCIFSVLPFFNQSCALCLYFATETCGTSDINFSLIFLHFLLPFVLNICSGIFRSWWCGWNCVSLMTK